MESQLSSFISGVLLLISLAGTTTNSLVITLIIRNKKLWNRQTLLILTLAIADLLMATFGILPCFVSSLYQRWIFGNIACQAEAFLCSFVGIGTKGILTVLAVDRALMIRTISKPTGEKSAIYIIAVWVFAFIVTSPPLFGWGKFTIEAPGFSCSVDWESANVNSLTYITFLMLVDFVLPLILIISSYATICVALRKSKVNCRPSRISRGERRVSLIIAALILTFLITWLPYSTMATMKFAASLNGHLQSSENQDSLILYLPILLAKSSIVYNPLIYAVFNSQFRAAWSNLLNCTKDAQYGRYALGNCQPQQRFQARKTETQLPA